MGPFSPATWEVAVSKVKPGWERSTGSLGRQCEVRSEECTMRALLLEAIHDDAAFALRDAGFEVERLDRALPEDELVERLAGVHLLGLRSNTQLTDRALQAGGDLLAVGAFCIGTNQIDLASASERGVAVFNAPFSNTRSVVELALSEVIALT